MSTFAATLRRHLRGEVKEQEPLAQRTSVRVGGKAELWVRPADLAEVELCVREAAQRGQPATVLGGGANTLVSDEGVDGLVLRLPTLEETADFTGEGARFTLGAGQPIAVVARLMKEHDLVGAEFLAGIPGTLGGAVAMNAGTKHGELARVCEEVECVTPDGTRWLPREGLGFAYRRSTLPERSVVTRVRLRLQRADAEGLAASREAMRADLDYRRRTQPLELPTFGSVFTNPPGDFAGRLIEAAELRGTRRGAAQLSEKHGNWIVNHGGATAADVRWLMTLAQDEVRARFGVSLHAEVKLVGRWSS